MPKGVFYRLAKLLRSHERVQDTRNQSVEQMLLVFLWILAYDEPQRNTAARFHMSQSSVSRIYHKLINPMENLHTQFFSATRL